MRFPLRMIAAATVAYALSVSAAHASTIVDLSTNDSGSANGALYEWTNFSATGSGTINSFVRVQANGIEQGYNHSLGGNVPWDTKPGIHTHDIQYDDLVARTVLGVDYYEFLLDINEAANDNNRMLSLDNVQIFTRSSAITSADEDLSGLGQLRFNNDVGADGDVTVNLDYRRNSGSGSGDMFLLVPVSLFAGANADDYVYFYSKFSESGAGFEEWAMRNALRQGPINGPIQTEPVPEPGSMMLMGTGLLLAVKKFRRNQ